MKYATPQITMLASASSAIQNTTDGKPNWSQLDSLTGEMNAMTPAYQADE